MGNELISIIMPAYNEEKYINEAIESIKCQTYSNWELVIVDDASEDGTADIIMQHSLLDSRIKGYRFPENKGACAALNKALMEATGEYICWLSADDRYKEEMLESSLHYLMKHQEMQAVFSIYEFIDEKSNTTQVWKPNEGYLHIGEKGCVQPYATMVLIGNAFCACTVMATREAFQKAGEFNEKHPYAGDYDYMLRLSAYSNIGFLNKVNVQSRVHKGQVTNEGYNDLDAIRVFEEMLYREDIRKSLFQKAGLQDGRTNILDAFNIRLQLYKSINAEREIVEVEKGMEKFLKEFPLVIEADSYCDKIAEQMNMQQWSEAQKLLQIIPDKIQNFINPEKWGIIVASIFEYCEEYEEEKSILKDVLVYNEQNYEAHYMLGMIYESEGEDLRALEHYVMSLKFCKENEDDFKMLAENLKRFVNEKI